MKALRMCQVVGMGGNVQITARFWIRQQASGATGVSKRASKRAGNCYVAVIYSRPRPEFAMMPVGRAVAPNFDIPRRYCSRPLRPPQLTRSRDLRIEPGRAPLTRIRSARRALSIDIASPELLGKPVAPIARVRWVARVIRDGVSRGFPS